MKHRRLNHRAVAKIRAAWLAFALAMVAPSWAAAGFDGVTLAASPGTGPGQIRLDWIGGDPIFSIYRSSLKGSVVAPGNFVGESNGHTFSDTPGTGNIFYYVVTSPCVYNPPEICDGIDNDCDGITDNPGSEASCNLPNAVPACSRGRCVVAGCLTGFGDCDGAVANGCEAPTNLAQSNSPDIFGGADVMPGYARVASITNCGGCGQTCNDGMGCTTDLCVPVASAGGATGSCRHYDRSQCASARCAGTLQPGAPPPAEPSCAGQDNDGDGLPEAWETALTDPYTGANQTAGVDLNCDGEVSDSDGDLIWHEPPAGDNRKDIYLKIDYMAPSGSETVSHAPDPNALEAVVAAFDRAGMSLHIDPFLSEVPHHAFITFPDASPTGSCGTLPDAVSFYGPVYKGDPANFDPRRRIGYHYAVFGHDSCGGNSSTEGGSGMGEIYGNDSVMSLGSLTFSSPDQRVRAEAGTLMHELGHNFGLCHGGAGDPNAASICSNADVPLKPNHVSSMNFAYELGGIERAAIPGTLGPLDPNLPVRVDFSYGVEPWLDEGFLDESVGLGVTSPPFNRDIAWHVCFGQLVRAPASGPIDWNCDGFFGPPMPVDVNGDGLISILTSSDEWGSLAYGFQCRSTFQN
ncbi:MAG: hypothetical protein HY049_01905 [Acidobacteria bacterium]|nr:hypothetical protein [Acidobacteriota bacterium]